jgi:hypothetical protein
MVNVAAGGTINGSSVRSAVVKAPPNLKSGLSYAWPVAAITSSRRHNGKLALTCATRLTAVMLWFP